MSSSITTPDTSTTETNATTGSDHNGARPDGGDQPATDRAAAAGDRLWAALHPRPGGTAEELSADAGIGRSTAARILARRVADGTAARVPTDAKRSASRFAVPASADANPPDGTDDTAKDTSGPHTVNPGTPGDPVDDTDTGGRADHDDSPPTIEETAPGAYDDGAVDCADTGTGSTPGTTPEAAPDLDAVIPDAADTHPDLASTSEPARADDDSDDREDLVAARVTAGRGPRLAPGALPTR